MADTQEIKETAHQSEAQNRFFVIKIAPMKDRFDTPTAIVTVGNKTKKWPRMELQRNTYVPVPGAVVDVLEQTMHPIYTPAGDGEHRKNVSYSVRYPVQEKIEITAEGYKKLRKVALQGKLTAQQVAQYRV